MDIWGNLILPGLVGAAISAVPSYLLGRHFDRARESSHKSKEMLFGMSISTN